jgi:hypothetical protein
VIHEIFGFDKTKGFLFLVLVFWFFYPSGYVRSGVILSDLQRPRRGA